MGYKTSQLVSVLNLNLFESMKTELKGKEVGEFSIMGKWTGRHSFAY